ncbi:MAG: hypothetical protein IT377_02695 [Polyangiaceae bacterium]|nr:hypothetical protein [Polyangiaceae bacterium]
MTLYTAVVFVHVASATFLVGGATSSPFVRRAMRRAGTVRELSAWADFMRQSSRANPAVAIALLATGLYLGTAGWWNSAWFVIAVAFWVMNGAWGARVLATEGAKIGAAAALLPDGPVPPALDQLRRSERMDLASSVMIGADAAVMFSMIAKPEWPIALAVAGLGVGGAFALHAIRRRTAELAPAR